MTSLCLTLFTDTPHTMSLLSGNVSNTLLYNSIFCSGNLLMLSGPEANMYRTECIMRGLPLSITIVEPGDKVSLGLCQILHLSNEYPNFNDDGYVWINRP